MKDNTKTLTIFYGDTENPQTWRHEIFDVQEVTPGVFQAVNYKLNRPDERFFEQTLVDMGTHLENRIFEQDHGKDSVGDIVVVLRKSPDGRWFVDIGTEPVFITPTESFTGMRITRSSKSNIEQALKREGEATVGNKWSNPARIGGKQIMCHVVVAGYAPQLVNKGSSVDVYQYGQQHVDLLGAGAFFNALISIPYGEIAHEVLSQLRDPNKTVK